MLITLPAPRNRKSCSEAFLFAFPPPYSFVTSQLGLSQSQASTEKREFDSSKTPFICLHFRKFACLCFFFSRIISYPHGLSSHISSPNRSLIDKNDHLQNTPCTLKLTHQFWGKRPPNQKVWISRASVQTTERMPSTSSVKSAHRNECTHHHKARVEKRRKTMSNPESWVDLHISDVSQAPGAQNFLAYKRVLHLTNCIYQVRNSVLWSHRGFQFCI